MSTLPLIIGHRGASAFAPENTLAAFALAIQEGADGIEFDVRLSRDREPVVVHDATLERTGMVNSLVGELAWKELQSIDVGSWFTGHTKSPLISYAGEKLPSLAQVFELFSPNKKLLYLEMKCAGSEAGVLAAEVVSLIARYEMAVRVIVASFDLSAIAEVKKIDAGIRTAALFEPRLTRPLSIVRRMNLVDLAVASGAAELALHHILVGPRVIEKARRCGLETVVWTVAGPEWIQRAHVLGIKALITNDPALMVHHRDGT
jgi:glycerophosphoryl diester phosphodiesterase